MDSVVALSEDKRRELFSATAARKGMTAAAAEKDFWVCWVLLKLFEHHGLSSKILFKGGTSLSKVFRLVERFSGNRGGNRGTQYLFRELSNVSPYFPIFRLNANKTEDV